MAFDLNDDRFSFGSRRRRRLEEVDPEYADSVLSNLGATALTGLGYVGGFIDKTTGSRALRGILGGKPRELLSILPGSDTFGITNPADRVTGAELNAAAFGTSANPDLFTMEGAGGIATELLLNPLNVAAFGGSALTNIGKVAKKMGIVPKGGAAKHAGLSVGTQQGRQLASRVAKEMGISKRAAIDMVHNKPLGGSMTLGLPFGLSDQAAFNLAPAMGAAGRFATGLPLVGKHIKTAADAAGRGLQLAKGVFGRPQQGALGAGQGIAEAFYGAKPAAVLRGMQQGDELLKLLPPGALAESSTPQLSRMMEGLEKTIPTEYQPFIDAFRKARADNLLEHQRAGTLARPMDDYNLSRLNDQEVQNLIDETAAAAARLGRTPANQAGQLPAWHLNAPKSDPKLEYAPRQAHPEFIALLEGKPNRLMRGEDMASKAVPDEVVQRWKGFKHLGKDQINDIFENLPDTYTDANGVVRQWSKPKLQNELFTKYLGQNSDELAAIKEHKRLWEEEGGWVPIGKKRMKGDMTKGKPNPRKPGHVASTTSWKKQNARLAKRLNELEDVHKQAGMLAELRLETGSLAYQVFPHHSMTDLFEKLMGDSMRFAQADELHKGFAHGAMTKAEAARLGIAASPLKDVLENANMTIEGAAYQRTLSELQKVHGAAATKVEDFVVPTALAADVSRIGKRMTSPVELKKFLEGFWDPITQATKTGQTVVWPAYHMREMMGAGWQHWVHGATDPKAATILDGLMNPFKLAKDAMAGKTLSRATEIQEFAGKTAQEATDALQIELKWIDETMGHADWHTKNSPMRVKQLADMIPGKQPGFLESFDAFKQAGMTTEQFKVYKTFPEAGRKTATYVDNLKRRAAYIAKRLQGYAPLAARQEVIKMHYIFSDKALIDPVARRLIPYWGWIRNNTPATLKEVLEKPGGKIANAIRAAASARGKETGFLPQQLGSGVAAPIGGEKDGTQRFLSQTGLPFEDVGSQLTNPLAGTLGALNPMLKFPLEQVTQKQFFTGRDLKDLYSRTGMPQWTENLLMNSPLGRVSTTIGTAMDERKGLGARALNLGTGLRVTDVDMTRARQAAARDALEAELRKHPHIRISAGRPYVPKAMQDQITEEEKALLALYGQVTRTPRR